MASTSDPRAAIVPDECPGCGYADENCVCDDPDMDLECTWCGGDGLCDDNSDPLWDCDDNPHACHACGGSGRRKDQRVF